MTVRIGALQADAWAGLVLSPGPGEGFAFRFAVEKDGRSADLDDLFWLVHDVGPHAPDGSYARVSFDLERPFGAGQETPVVAREGRSAGLVLEWGRVGGAAVVGHVRAQFEGAVVVRAYLPWDWEGAWRAAGDGEAVAAAASGASAAALRIDPAVPSDPAEGGLRLRAPVAPGDVLRFAARLDDDADRALAGARRISLDGVDRTLAEAAAAYEARRTRVTGHLEGLAASVTDNLQWMVLLQPETGRLYTPAGRRWIFPVAPERLPEGAVPPSGRVDDHWTVFGWDSYFNALELSLEAPQAARETLLAGLRTAYPNGCVPNWRSRWGGTPDRSQPPLGSLAALKLHLRRPDPAMLEEAYPRLAAWADWWAADHEGRPRRRPGPRGLFTWGSDLDRIDPRCPPWEKDVGVRRLAGWESGQDDLPTWDEAEPAPDGGGCLALDPVDANAYRVLDLECLARIADELGRGDAAAARRREADDLRALVNEHLWDADRETYADRRWDGTFTPCRTASHFLVLAAGIATRDRGERMVEHLRERFWGEWVVPTIARGDPRFEEQQYWRGTIWPPTNYLIRMGLARYGYDALAGELAARSARLFLESRRATGLCRENFDSRTGEGGGQRHQSWGPLFGLLALEEIADVDPWDGLRVGGLRAEGPSELTNLDIGARGARTPGDGGRWPLAARWPRGAPPGAARWTRGAPPLAARWSLRVATGPDSLRLWVDGSELLESRGAVVLRNVAWEGAAGRPDGAGGPGGGGGAGAPDPTRFFANTSSEDPVELTVHLPGERWAAVVDGRREELSEPRVRLGAGRHDVEILSAVGASRRG